MHKLRLWRQKICPIWSQQFHHHRYNRLRQPRFVLIYRGIYIRWLPIVCVARSLHLYWLFRVAISQPGKCIIEGCRELVKFNWRGFVETCPQTTPRNGRRWPGSAGTRSALRYYSAFGTSSRVDQPGPIHREQPGEKSASSYYEYAGSDSLRRGTMVLSEWLYFPVPQPRET